MHTCLIPPLLLKLAINIYPASLLIINLNNSNIDIANAKFAA